MTTKPPKWDNSIKLEKAINNYFEKCEIEGRVPTREGLCLHLGIGLTAYSNYRKGSQGGGIAEIIEEAELRLSDEYIQGGLSRKFDSGMVRLMLINRSTFKDKVEQEQSGEVTITIKREIIE